jgi:hypothetical protein
MQRLLCALALLLGPFVVACEERTPPPGYVGPVAGSEAQAALSTLLNRRFEDRDGVLGGGTWTVGAFSVTPYDGDPPRKGPHIDLTRGERKLQLPMEADGDAADLYRRVNGSDHPHLSKATSDAYRLALARAASAK